MKLAQRKRKNKDHFLYVAQLDWGPSWLKRMNHSPVVRDREAMSNTIRLQPSNWRAIQQVDQFCQHGPILSQPVTTLPIAFANKKLANIFKACIYMVGFHPSTVSPFSALLLRDTMIGFSLIICYSVISNWSSVIVVAYGTKQVIIPLQIVDF